MNLTKSVNYFISNNVSASFTFASDDTNTCTSTLNIALC